MWAPTKKNGLSLTSGGLQLLQAGPYRTRADWRPTTARTQRTWEQRPERQDVALRTLFPARLPTEDLVPTPGKRGTRPLPSSLAGSDLRGPRWPAGLLDWIHTLSLTLMLEHHLGATLGIETASQRRRARVWGPNHTPYPPPRGPIWAVLSSEVATHGAYGGFGAHTLGFDRPPRRGGHPDCRARGTGFGPTLWACPVLVAGLPPETQTNAAARGRVCRFHRTLGTRQLHTAGGSKAPVGVGEGVVAFTPGPPP